MVRDGAAGGGRLAGHVDRGRARHLGAAAAHGAHPGGGAGAGAAVPVRAGLLRVAHQRRQGGAAGAGPGVDLLPQRSGPGAGRAGAVREPRRDRSPARGAQRGGGDAGQRLVRGGGGRAAVAESSPAVRGPAAAAVAARGGADGGRAGAAGQRCGLEGERGAGAIQRLQPRGELRRAPGVAGLGHAGVRRLGLERGAGGGGAERDAAGAAAGGLRGSGDPRRGAHSHAGGGGGGVRLRTELQRLEPAAGSGGSAAAGSR